MKGYLYILFFVSFACSGKVSITEDEIMPDVYYAEGSFKPYTGKCNVLSRDSRVVLEQFTYKKGLLHGKAFAWYKNGQLKRKGSYLDGKLSGAWEFWDDKGHKTMEASFKDDALDGPYTSLKANGQIKEKGIYTENRQTGKWIREAGDVAIKSGCMHQP
jgi:antitoxin component YwqK of YwqJK toxin-antitoxin module